MLLSVIRAISTNIYFFMATEGKEKNERMFGTLTLKEGEGAGKCVEGGYFTGKQVRETFCDCETEPVRRKERNGDAECSNG